MNDHYRACKIIKNLINEKDKKVLQANNSLYIVVILENLKKVGEGALRWSFFTLNMFMLSVSIIHSN